MAGEKLNKQNRKQIRSALLEHRFGERESRLAQEENDVAYQVWYRAIGGDKGLRCLRSIPSGWLPCTSHVSACVQDANGREVEYARLELSQRTPTPYSVMGEAEILLDHEDLGRRVVALEKEREEVKREKRRLCQEVDAVLESLRSFKQLREHWPEAAAFLPEGDQRTAGELAVPLSRLNQDLGLAQSGEHHAAE